MSTDAHVSHPRILQDRMRDLLGTGDYSDLTITCKQYSFKVHRAIICPQWHHFNPPMSDAFKGPGNWVLDLPDDEPVAIYRVLEYLYTEDYTEEGYIAQYDCPIALQVAWINIEVYRTAEKYQLSSLMTLAARKLHRWAGEYRRSVAFLDVLEKVLYLERVIPQSKLRSLFVKLTADHIHHFIERPQFRKMLNQFEGFQYEVLMSVVKHKRRQDLAIGNLKTLR
ncbi:hypothetical protein BO94DRAFT_599766 [Aspergillus sclerotioniger CBS 115572]|uniref:BTB domain-containing protein n=1 Tax=Aspergillus sclerotioniger CBS 115572 TaxID=1450535 RepID=A0A317WDT8_9EURO|nr:hypothetical protein BO94DRAFT_599766 [Aspergillus sclerotioniger CBS 115572]PWY83228.1 hypothetical protein BO94DRAFT_599766 [Aspergillus sclerotioniger CBS 115572]